MIDLMQRLMGAAVLAPDFGGLYDPANDAGAPAAKGTEPGNSEEDVPDEDEADEPDDNDEEDAGDEDTNPRDEQTAVDPIDEAPASYGYDSGIETSVQGVEREMSELESMAGELMKYMERDPAEARTEAEYDAILAQRAAAQGQLKALDLQHRSMQRRLAEMRVSSWQKQTEAGRRTHKDFDQVIGSPAFKPAPHVADIVSRMSNGAEAAYRLAKSPRALARLNSLSPVAAALELGRMMGAGSKPGPMRKLSQAPAPLKRVQARGGKGGDVPSFASLEKQLGYK